MSMCNNWRTWQEAGKRAWFPQEVIALWRENICTHSSGVLIDPGTCQHLQIQHPCFLVVLLVMWFCEVKKAVWGRLCSWWIGFVLSCRSRMVFLSGNSCQVNSKVCSEWPQNNVSIYSLPCLSDSRNTLLNSYCPIPWVLLSKLHVVSMKKKYLKVLPG